MRAAWIAGALLVADEAPERAELDRRAGPGLIETMRARNGRIAFRDRHLARIARSRAACGIGTSVTPRAIDAALDAVVDAAAVPDLLVRLVVGRSGVLVAEADVLAPLRAAPETATAHVVPGLWSPGDRTAEHKLTGRDHWLAAEAAASAAGADVAIAADAEGRLGEASRAAVFVVAGRCMTAPVAGILPGIGRGVVIDLAGDILEQAPPVETWRRASEVFLVSAVRGVTSVVAIDGVPVGAATPGPVAVRLAEAFAVAFAAETAAASV